jgi:arylsulfatase A-like enzyme
MKHRSAGRAAARASGDATVALRMARRSFLAGGLPLLLWPRRAASASRPKPNILFILIDTLRADRVTCYGHREPTTPKIDRLAAEGVRFATVHTASPWTMPSVMTLFTALHPTVHGATSYQRRASLKVTTLAERLKRLGYRRTVGIVSNPTVNSRYGFAQGFDQYDDYSVFFAHELNLFEIEDAERHRSITEAVTSHTVTRLAGEWLAKEGRRRPWFLFLLYFDPHDRYVPPAPWDRRFDPHPNAASRKRKDVGPHLMRPDATAEETEHALALYDGEIGYTDHHVGQLLQRLDALGLRDDTLVVLVSDHGEEFLDHGGVRHGRTLYDEQTRGVLILRQPGALPRGAVVTAPTCHLDLVPTLLDCLGEEAAPSCQGVSRLPLLRGAGARRPDRGRRPIFLEGAASRNLRGVVLGRHKLIRDTVTGREELYDLATDPGEKTNLRSRTPAAAEELRAALDRHIEHCRLAARPYQMGGTVARPRLTRRDIEVLRALGYLQ